MRTNEPNMNITTQVNKALNDIRDTVLIHRPNYMAKSQYQLNAMLQMCHDHYHDIAHKPWSEIQPMIEEEFKGLEDE